MARTNGFGAGKSCRGGREPSIRCCTTALRTVTPTSVKRHAFASFGLRRTDAHSSLRRSCMRLEVNRRSALIAVPSSGSSKSDRISSVASRCPEMIQPPRSLQPSTSGQRGAAATRPRQGVFELQDDGRQPRCLDLVLGPHGNRAQGSRPFIAVFLKPQSDSARDRSGFGLPGMPRHYGSV